MVTLPLYIQQSSHPGRGRDASYLAPPAQNRTCSFPAYGLYGTFFVKGASRHFCRALLLPIFVVLCCFPFLSCFVASFFCSTHAASILPSRPHIAVAVARSGGQGRRFFSAAEGLSLTDASTAAGCRRSGGWPREDPRGACHWPRSNANHACIRLNPRS